MAEAVTVPCTCPGCGHRNNFYLWSWAGNGVARCKACRARISYYTKKITPPAPADTGN